MAHILNIETATTNCSVSLSKNGETLVLKEDNNLKYSHAETLHVFIEQALKEANLNTKELDAIAVSKGPGSYTGLRIGVSAAKGLCFALEKPLISIPTLQSLAFQIKDFEGLIIPLLDARRMEVYSAVYNSKYCEERKTLAEIINQDSFKEYLELGTVNFIGPGVEKTQKEINHKNAVFVEDKLPSAREMSVLSYKKYKQHLYEDVAYFEPYYLKDFIAL